jgi:cytochrome c peroxidase
MRRLLLGTLLVSASLFAGAQGESHRADIPLGLDLYMPVPEENSFTLEKVDLGKRLFFDPILSRDQSLACVFCHDPGRAYTDGRAVAIGVFGRQGTRSVPTLVNRGYGASFFWDGRMPNLEQQVLQPILEPKEMDMTLDEAVARLKDSRDYPGLFRAAFGAEVSAEGLSRALAAYLRTILSGDAPVDRYMNGEREALSEQARQGLAVFRGKGNCTACHVGPTFTDERFHDTGVAWRDGQLLDPGRFFVSGKAEDQGAFKVPTLREIARTAPYMHDGSLATLEEVIEFYDRGGNPNPYLDPEIHPLHLTGDEKKALATFLFEALSGDLHDGQLR